MAPVHVSRDDARGGAAARVLVALAFLVLTLPPPAVAVTPKTWTVSTQKDLLEGEGVSVRIGPEGVVTLGLAAERRATLDEAVVWAVAPGPDGSAWVGTGSSGRLLRVSARGEVTEAARFDELQVTALLAEGDHVLAATSPAGAVYRVAASAPAGTKPELVARPDAQYIWALARGGDGTLYAGTGAVGKVLALRDGKATVLALTSDVNVVSLLALPDGSLVAGTAERGLVLRIARDGKVTVLYDSGFREARALALDREGNVLAVVNGGPSHREGKSEANVTVSADSDAEKEKQASDKQQASLSLPAPESLTEQVAELVRIGKDGGWETIARTRGEVVYALAVAPWGETVLGTSKRLVVPAGGDDLAVVALAPAAGATTTGQVSAMAVAGGRLLVATSAPSSLFMVAGEEAHEGTYTSKVFAADPDAAFGALRSDALVPKGASLVFETRTGGSAEPDPTWSPWAATARDAHGLERVASAAARYVQWRARLTTGEGGHGPRLRSVSLAYQPRNQRPVVRSFTALPPGVLLQKGSPIQAVVEVAPPPLPSMFEELGAARAESAKDLKRLYRRGAETLTWEVSDPNDDDVHVKLAIHARDGGPLLPIRDGVEGTSFTFDTEALPDGWWVARIDADDGDDNPGAALSASRESDAFLVDNTPPRLAVVSQKVEGGRAHVRIEARDELSALWKAEWALDGGNFAPIFPVDGITDNLWETYEVVTDKLGPGEHLIVLRVADLANQSAAVRVVIKGSDGRRTGSDD